MPEAAIFCCSCFVYYRCRCLCYFITCCCHPLVTDPLLLKLLNFSLYRCFAAAAAAATVVAVDFAAVGAFTEQCCCCCCCFLLLLMYLFLLLMVSLPMMLLCIILLSFVSQDKKERIVDQWQQVAMVINRLCFYVFGLINATVWIVIVVEYSTEHDHLGKPDNYRPIEPYNMLTGNYYLHMCQHYRFRA